MPGGDESHIPHAEITNDRMHHHFRALDSCGSSAFFSNFVVLVDFVSLSELSGLFSSQTGSKNRSELHMY